MRELLIQVQGYTLTCAYPFGTRALGCETITRMVYELVGPNCVYVTFNGRKTRAAAVMETHGVPLIYEGRTREDDSGTLEDEISWECQASVAPRSILEGKLRVDTSMGYMYETLTMVLPTIRALCVLADADVKAPAWNWANALISLYKGEIVPIIQDNTVKA